METEKNRMRLLANGTLTRRQFIAGATTLGAAAALASPFVALPARAAGPRKGGRFTMGLHGGSSTDTLDPATLIDSMAINISWQTRNNLVEIDYKGDAIPELAESWEPSSDAATWRFKIRKGVEFHNGKTLAAEDVIYSIQYHMGEKSKSGAKSLLNQIQHIKADDTNSVVFTLADGNADFPYILSDYHLVMVPVGTTGGDFDSGIGTGGYILKEFEPGVRSLTKRNPNYWKPDRAHFDEVEIVCINDVSARTNALITGEVDYMNLCEKRTAKRLAEKPSVKVISTEGGMHYLFAMRTDTAPFDNNDVRLALKYAISREEILKLWSGYGAVGNDHPIASSLKFYASELPQREYDPDKAKFHLKRSGLRDATFPLHSSDFEGYIDHALLFKEHAAKAGINIQVKKEPTDGYYSNVWMKKPFFSSSWYPRPTVDMMFSTAYSAASDWNETFFKHSRFNELLKAARKELDDIRRREMYVECQRIVRDEGGAIIYAFDNFVEAVNAKVNHAQIASSNQSDGFRNAERWWFAS